MYEVPSKLILTAHFDPAATDVFPLREETMLLAIALSQVCAVGAPVRSNQ